MKKYSTKKVILSKLIESIINFTCINKNYENIHIPNKFLIYEPFGLGDCLMTSTMVEPIFKKYPDSEIIIICKPEWANLFKAHSKLIIHTFVFPWVDGNYNIIRYPLLKIWKFIKMIRAIKIDVGFDVRGDLRSHIMLVLFQCKRRIGFSNYIGSNISLKGSLLTDVIKYENKYKAKQNMDLLIPLSITASNYNYFIKKPKQSFSKEVIAIHLTASWEFRRWDYKKWIELIKQLKIDFNIPIMLIYYEMEISHLNNLIIYFKNDDQIKFVNVNSIENLIITIYNSKLFIGVDSGPLHIATALNKKTIALFGPGDVDVWGYNSENNIIIHHQVEYSCAPCIQNHCIKPENSCMSSITVDEVLLACKKILNYL